MTAKVASIVRPEPHVLIALLQYEDGEKRYILAPMGVTVGDVLESGQVCEPKTGNCMPLGSIPSGLEVHNVELTAGQGGRMVRGAGSAARIVAKEGDWVTIVLPSGEMRMVRKECRATIGRLSNPDHQNIRSARRAGCGTAANVRMCEARRRTGRPPDGRRRGTFERRTSSVLADGRAGQGRQDPQPAQDEQFQDHSKTPEHYTRAAGAVVAGATGAEGSQPQDAEREKTMGRSLKKGPFVDEKLLSKVAKQTSAGTRDAIKTWARRVHDRCRSSSVHLHGPQRESVQ